MSIGFSLFGQNIEDLVALAKHGESLGFEDAWLGEHIYAPSVLTVQHALSGRARPPVSGSDTHIYDVWVAMGALIAATSRMTIAPGVAILPLRNPLITARAMITAHRISGGRTRLAIGIGWLPEEYEALGVPFKERVSRTEEGVAILRKALAGGEFEHSGRHFNFPLTQMTPERIDVPILFGGTDPRALRRAALMGDGWYSPLLSFEDTVEVRRQIEHVRGQNGLAGKSYTYFARPKLKIDRDLVAKYRDAGFENLVVTLDMIHPESPKTTTLDYKKRVLETCAKEIGLKP
jgi:alkanesulfonate monooxygenase SsuD/methylene tetrahydromethanopterin reductase-like flavin-dependent oxidoreductase (luciferase family)